MKWQPVAVEEISVLVTKGTTPTTFGKDFTDQGVNFIKAEALNGDSNLDTQSFSFIDEETHSRLQRSILLEEDVLVTIAGAKIGKCGFIRPEHLPANTNQAVGIVRVRKEKAQPRFLYYFFKQPSTFSFIQGSSSQAAQPNLNLAMLKAIKVPLPPIAIQCRISDTLSAYDDLIENNRRRIDLLEAAARLLYREWFVSLRFPGHEHVQVKGGVPDGWERKALSELAESVIYGYTASAQTEPVGPKFLRITDIVPSVIDWDTVPYCQPTDEEIEKYLLKEGDIVVARTGATVGYAKRLGALEDQTIFASYLIRMRFSAEIDDILVGIYIESDEYKAFVLNNAGGAAQPNANAKVLSSAKILVPPILLQSEYRVNVEPLLKQKDILQQQNRRLKQARDLLLPRLMNGEIEV